MKTYDVKVTRDGRWWMIEIPGLDGLTQARRLDQIENMAREYIAVTLDVPLSHVVVSVSRIDVDGQDVLGTKVLVDALRTRAKETEEMATVLTREFAAALTAARVPVRDVSKVLGVSHQRVSQIARTSTKAESTLARAILAAKEKGQADFVLRFESGRIPEVVQAKTAKKRSPVSKSPATEATVKRPTIQSAALKLVRKSSAKDV